MPNWKKVITSGSDAHLNQITASGFNLVNSNEEVIATEPFTAMLVIVVVAILSLILASRGIANRQF